MNLLSLFQSQGDDVAYYLLVFVLALLAWLFRTVADAEPDPFLLNLTLFAGVGLLIHEVEKVTRGGPLTKAVVILGIIVLVLIVLQIIVFRYQIRLTQEHYKSLLTTYKGSSATTQDIEYFAAAAVRITGVDFYPEFYERFAGTFDNTRASRRELAYMLIPSSTFDKGRFKSSDLTVPQATRKTPWRCYAIICGAVWLVFLLSLLFD